MPNSSAKRLIVYGDVTLCVVLSVLLSYSGLKTEAELFNVHTVHYQMY
jgi:hypothetical protein